MMCMKPRHGAWHLVSAPTGKDAFELRCWRRLFLLKSKFIYFNWRLITLQYCIGFAFLHASLSYPKNSSELDEIWYFAHLFTYGTGNKPGNK